MSRVSVTFRGLDGALRELSALHALREVARTAADLTAAATRKKAIQLTTRRYNLDEDTLAPFVTLGQTGTAGQTDGYASVRLMARPIPIAVFNPTVRMQPVRIAKRNGGTYTRRLPTVWVKRFRSGGAKQLKPFFPLEQRVDGATADSIRRRIGAGRDRLTGPRFYTFPKRFLDEIRPQLVEFVGDRGSGELQGAYRKWLKGQRVLRGPR